MIGYFYDKKANIGLILVKFIHIKKTAFIYFPLIACGYSQKWFPISD